MTSIKTFIKFLLKIINLRITKIDTSIYINKDDLLPFQKDNQNYELYFEGLKKSKNEKSDNDFKQSRFLDLISLVEFILKKNNTHDFVEVGCWHGHSSYMICHLIKKYKKNINLNIFDSFKGLSKETISDKNLLKFNDNQILKIRRQFEANEDFVKNEVLGEFDFINIYKGWVPEKFYILKNKKFSFVHIDVDLYEPTIESLKFFYPRLIDGGVIVCDDYNSKVFDGAKRACDEFFGDKEVKFSFAPAIGSFFIIK